MLVTTYLHVWSFWYEYTWFKITWALPSMPGPAGAYVETTSSVTLHIVPHWLFRNGMEECESLKLRDGDVRAFFPQIFLLGCWDWGSVPMILSDQSWREVCPSSENSTCIHQLYCVNVFVTFNNVIVVIVGIWIWFANVFQRIILHMNPCYRFSGCE